MSPINVEDLLVPISEDRPSGDNLEYDPDFLALERAAAPKAEQVMGDSVIAGGEPDWADVAERATVLFGRAKDLRVAMHLTTSALRTQGLPGFAAGLEVIRKLVEDFWPSVHPQLDPDDDDDPTFRVNSVAPLSAVQGVLGYLRTTPFAQSARTGKYSLRDLRIANGTLKLTAAPSRNDDDDAAPAAAPTMVLIEACCRDCPEAMLAGNTAAASAALDHAKAIDRAFTDRIGSQGPNLKELLADLFELKKFLDAKLALRQPAAPAAGGADDDDDFEEGGAAAPAAGGVAASGGRIATPQDVIRRIEEICEYYARTEPSSPVPLLLRRAQRLVGRNFIELLQDLAPGGIAQLQVVSGPVGGAGGAAASSGAPAPPADDFDE